MHLKPRLHILQSDYQASNSVIRRQNHYYCIKMTNDGAWYRSGASWMAGMITLLLLATSVTGAEGLWSCSTKNIIDQIRTPLCPGLASPTSSHSRSAWQSHAMWQCCRHNAPSPGWSQVGFTFSPSVCTHQKNRRTQKMGCVQMLENIPTSPYTKPSPSLWWK